jgi:hypothetical protein
MSKKSVQRSLEVLEELGYVQHIRRTLEGSAKNDTNIYILPSLLAARPPVSSDTSRDSQTPIVNQQGLPDHSTGAGGQTDHTKLEKLGGNTRLVGSHGPGERNRLKNVRSFLSLPEEIQNLRPTEKQAEQIISLYTTEEMHTAIEDAKIQVELGLVKNISGWIISVLTRPGYSPSSHYRNRSSKSESEQQKRQMREQIESRKAAEQRELLLDTLYQKALKSHIESMPERREIEQRLHKELHDSNVFYRDNVNLQAHILHAALCDHVVTEIQSFPTFELWKEQNA